MAHVHPLIAAGVGGGGIIQQVAVSLRAPRARGALVPLLQPWQAPGPDISVLFPPRHLRAAKVKAFVEFAAQLFD
jgi:LysR family transcriptional regulator for bpeEF and oprC